MLDVAEHHRSCHDVSTHLSGGFPCRLFAQAVIAGWQCSDALGRIVQRLEWLMALWRLMACPSSTLTWPTTGHRQAAGRQLLQDAEPWLQICTELTWCAACFPGFESQFVTWYYHVNSPAMHAASPKCT